MNFPSSFPSTNPETAVMLISNRVTLDDLTKLPLSELVTLPASQLALLQQDLAELLARAKTLKDRLDSGLDLKYRDGAAALRRNAEKDTGTVRIPDGEFAVVADLPKRVKWDQARLRQIVQSLMMTGVPTLKDSKIACPKFSP